MRDKSKQLLKAWFPWLPALRRSLTRGAWHYWRNSQKVWKELAAQDVTKWPEDPWFIFVYQGFYPNKLVRSLSKQSYKNWKVVSIDECTTNCEEGNSWICFIDRDIKVVKGGLRFLAGRIENQGSHVLAFYTDHVMVESLIRVQFLVKPAWSPDYFNAVDYIGISLWISTTILKNNPLYRNLNSNALMAARNELLTQLPNDRVKHLPIPAIVVFKGLSRTVSNTTSLVNPITECKNTAIDNNSHSKISIIIPTKNSLNFLKPCIESVVRNAGELNIEIIVVDNQSDCIDTLNYLEKLEEEGIARVLKYSKLFNFSKINNYAVGKAEGDYICLLNNDTEVITPHWLKAMLCYGSKEDVGCVGAKLYYPDGLVQHAGVVMGYGGGADHAFKCSKRTDAGYMQRLVTAQNYSAVTAACLLVRKSVYLEVGGLDESLTVAFNDVDFCLKVKKAGYRNVWVPES